jgi:hypothetical protein
VATNQDPPSDGVSRRAFLAAEHYNHFEMLETMANPYGLLGRAAPAQMGLART